MRRELRFASPLGDLILVSNGEALLAVDFAEDPAAKGGDHPAAGDGVLDAARRQLDEYFRGRRQRFELPLAAAGTPFQQTVWRALRDIPYAETRSYGDIAARIGRPGAARAVGLANGRNPIAIIVPCHRVIGASGTLIGYAGGIERKRRLLELEARGPAAARMTT